MKFILYWFECLIFVICAGSFCFVHERVFWLILRVGKLYSRSMRELNILGQKSNGNVMEPSKAESKMYFSPILHHSKFISEFIQK